MQILEQLYDCAEQHLRSEPRNWVMFGREVAGICNADMVLYRTSYDETGENIVSADYLTTTNENTIQAYKDLGLQQNQPIPENSLTPLEPVRRTDMLDNAAMLSLPVYGDFVKKFDYFYQIFVPAILPDKSILGLLLWRGQASDDFDDLEKQRLALFLRHLIGAFDLEKMSSDPTKNNVAQFGEKYSLTPAETAILGALLEGHSLREISQSTQRSYGTVRWHVQNILDKCQVNSQKSLLKEFYGLIIA